MAASRSKLINKPGQTVFIKPAAAIASAYRFVTSDASNVDSVTLSAADDQSLGVIYQTFAAAESGECIVHGIVLVEAGGTVATGDYVNASTNGVAIVSATGKPIRGRCLVGGGSGDLISVDLDDRRSATP